MAAKKSSGKKAPLKKAVATKTTATKKTVGKKVVAAKTPLAKKAVATKATATKKAVATKAPTAKKAIAKKAPAAKTTATTKAAAKAVTEKAPLKKAAPANAPSSKGSTAAPKPSKAPVVGSVAPAFSTVDHAGKAVSSAALRGKPYVLYFYPKDDTPGCTREACGFRDLGAEFTARGAAIFGVSPDSVKSHQAFASKYQLPFSLLIDEDKKLASSYGAWALKKNYGREYLGIVRSTFLVDRDGKIAHVWPNVKVDGHVDAVLSRLGALT